MFWTRPGGEVVAALSDQLQREVRTEAVDLGSFPSSAKSAARSGARCGSGRNSLPYRDGTSIFILPHE